MKQLTVIQKQTLDFIDNYQKEHKVMPTLVEMSNKFNVSVSAIIARLEPIIKKGHLERKNIYIIKK